jgi:transcriptional regulator with XRE-family HTH domain
LETSKKRISEALHDAKKTQSDLARKLGLNRSTVSQLLNSEAGDLPLKYVHATADITGYSIEWLANGKGPKKNVPGVDDTSSEYSTETKLEMLVESQRKTIQLLEEKIKRLEEQLAHKIRN